MMTTSSLVPFMALLLVYVLATLQCFPLTSAQETTTTSATTTNSSPESSSTMIIAQKTFSMYHSFGQNKPFLKRGTITFSTESSSSSNDNDHNNVITTTVENNNNWFSDEQVLQDMDELVANNGFYRIKIVDDIDANNNSDNTVNLKGVLASVPGCEVRRANFREEIALSMSQTGSILSLSYTPLVSPLAAQCQDLPPLFNNNNNDEDSPKREYKFQTLLTYTTSTPGMTLPKILPKIRPPPGLNAIKHSNNNNNSNQQQPQTNHNQQEQYTYNKFQSEQDDEKKQKEQNQSFLRRYWYIILPISIMTFLGGEDPPSQQQQQQQQQRQSTGSTPTTVTGGQVPVSNTHGSGVRQRRGKRDQ